MGPLPPRPRWFLLAFAAVVTCGVAAGLLAVAVDGGMLATTDFIPRSVLSWAAQTHINHFTDSSADATGIIVSRPFSGGAAGTVPSAPAVRWAAERAAFSGDGCPGTGTAALSFDEHKPNSLSIELQALKIDMSTGAPELVTHRSCRLRVPFVVPQGFLLLSVSQRIAAGIQKSDNGRGYLTTRNRIGPLVAEPVDLTFPYTGRAVEDAGSVRLAAISRADLSPALAQPQFRVERTIYRAGPRALCAARAEIEASLESLVELHGERGTTSEALRIEDDLQKDVTLSYDFVLVPCKNWPR